MSEEGSLCSSFVGERVREIFTQTGASVVSSGVGNIVVELPADYPDLTLLVSRLKDEFDATCDLSTIQKTPRLTVWVPRQSMIPADATPPPNKYAKWMPIAASILVFLVTAFMVSFHL